MNRVVDIEDRRIMAVTDLHGTWEAYARYRDLFLSLWNRGDADHLLLLGDFIHGYGPPETDQSLAIVLDIIQLQAELSKDRVTVLLGNHELPHIYGITLRKGDLVFTPRFEHSLGQHREVVTQFFKSLPFMARTSGGLLFTHAGASHDAADPENAARLMDWSHQALLDEADTLLGQQDVKDLVARIFNLDEAGYLQRASENLAVTGPHDPRYRHLLRGLLISGGLPEFDMLWQFLFTQCEDDIAGRMMYAHLVDRFLQTYSGPHCPAHVLVTGHMVTRGAHSLVTDRHFRLSSWTHARPSEAGACLMVDANARFIHSKDLIPHLVPLFARGR